jgi:branched-chain amino acid transport system substrate-binding protein
LPCAAQARINEAVNLRPLSAVLFLTVLAGCGTRVDHAAVIAAAGAGQVSFSPQTLTALREDAPPMTAARVPRRTRPDAPTTSPQTLLPQGAPVPVPMPPAAAAGTTSPTRTAAGLPATTPKGPAPTRPQAHAQVTASAPVTACARQLDAVVIGQVGAFSGVTGPIFGAARTALAVWAQDINARGGLACHPVKVYSADDGGDPTRSAYLVHQMTTEHHVVALVGNLVLSPNGFVPAVEAAQVPAIGGTTGTLVEFNNRRFFPAGASVDDLILGLLRDGVDLGHKRLGVVYCVEASLCTDDYKKVRDEYAKEAGAQLVYDSPASITQPDYTAVCLNARDAKVDLLGLALDGASIARLARSCDAVGYRPLLATSAAVFSPENAADPTVRKFGVATVTGEAPWFLDDQPGLTTYRQAMARYAPTTLLTGAATIGWTAAELFRAAVEKVADQARNGPITTALVIQGLGRIHDDGLGGLVSPLGFTPDEPHATSTGCVYYELLTTAGWTAPRGSRPVCLRR